MESEDSEDRGFVFSPSSLPISVKPLHGRGGAMTELSIVSRVGVGAILVQNSKTVWGCTKERFFGSKTNSKKHRNLFRIYIIRANGETQRVTKVRRNHLPLICDLSLLLGECILILGFGAGGRRGRDR